MLHILCTTIDLPVLFLKHLINIHLFNRRTSILLLILHLFILLWLLSLRFSRRDLGCLGLGPVHDGCTCVDDIFTSLIHLGRSDDGVDILGLLGLSSKSVVEPLLGSCALFNLSISLCHPLNVCENTYDLLLVGRLDVRVLLIIRLSLSQVGV